MTMDKFKRNKGDFGGVSRDRSVLKKDETGKTIEHENDATFWFRCRSFVDIRTGKMLAERKQQSILLAKADAGNQFKNWKNSDTLHLKAAEIRRSIIAWEEQASNGQVVAGDGSVPAARVEAIAPTNEMTVADFFEKVFLPGKRKLRDSANIAAITVHDYEKIWNKFLKAHFNGTQTFKNYATWKAISWLENLTKKNGKPYGEAVIRKIRAVAQAIFTDAIRRGFLAGNNPWDGVKVKELPIVKSNPGEDNTASSTESGTGSRFPAGTRA